jgi:PhnB protein
MAEHVQGVVPMLSYREGVAAMAWLSRVFGFEPRASWLDDDGVLTHGEMSTGSGSIMLATPSPDYEGPALHRTRCRAAAAWSAVPWVVDGVLVHVDDVEAHFDRATREGAPLLSGIEDGPDGSRLYRSEDVEGHRWMFLQRVRPS